MTYSQFGQDLQVINNIYRGKYGGYFIEVGAHNGVTNSNTYLLEKEYGWKGIVVECNPIWRDNIIKIRNCIFFPYSLYVETNHHSAPVKTLTTLLNNANAPNFIEYLSLNTEDSEYEILKAHDFDTYIFGYICVKHNNVPENRVNIRNLLESKGYAFYRENRADDEYIHSSVTI